MPFGNWVIDAYRAGYTNPVLSDKYEDGRAVGSDSCSLGTEGLYIKFMDVFDNPSHFASGTWLSL